jgi:nitrogen fixation protein NifB
MDLISLRPTPPRGGGDQRWSQLAETLGDCHTLLVNGVGPNPKKVLSEAGLHVQEVEGLISDAFYALGNGQSLSHLFKRESFACGTSCSGNGEGC